MNISLQFPILTAIYYTRKITVSS